MRIGQLLRFGTVGVIATTIHIALFIALIELLGIGSGAANVLAYLVACTIGYAGHSAWTFRLSDGMQRPAGVATFAKFLIASLLGLGLNALVVFVVVEIRGTSYLYATPFMAILVPLAVFMLNRCWVFPDSTAVRPHEPGK